MGLGLIALALATVWPHFFPDSMMEFGGSGIGRTLAMWLFIQRSPLPILENATCAV